MYIYIPYKWAIVTSQEVSYQALYEYEYMFMYNSFSHIMFQTCLNQFLPWFCLGGLSKHYPAYYTFTKFEITFLVFEPFEV